MDLFVVNRFGAEENSNSPSEQKNLSKLLSTIEKRKKSKEKAAERNQTETRHNEDQESKEGLVSLSSPKKSKKRKKVLEEDSVAAVTSCDNTAIIIKKEVDSDLGDLNSPPPTKKSKGKARHKIDDADSSYVNGDMKVDSEKISKSIKEENGVKQEEEGEEDGDEKGKKLSKRKNKKKKDQDVNEKYTTLGEEAAVLKHKHKMERDELLSAFPKWLSEPTIIESHFDQPSQTVDDIPLLAPWLVKKLKSNGVKFFFPVQYAVIPAVLESTFLPPQNWPRDLCVSSPTGSGKTLAFVLPVVQALSDRVVPAIRALVVLPTQDLAVQVSRVFRQYVLDTALRVKLLSLETFDEEQRSLCFYSEQKKCYESRVDIVVTTPGRLVEHLNNTPGFSLDELRYLIVDEADLLIERSQHDWMLHLEQRLCTGRSEWKAVPPATVSVLESVRRPPHRLYFSATLSHDPEVLSKMRLFQPQLFSVARFKVYGMNKTFTAADGAVRYEHSKRLLSDLVVPRQLEQFYVECDLATKPLQLYQLLMANDWDAVIVFANSVEAVHRLVTLLRVLGEGSLTVAEISSAVSTEERITSARDFLRGKVRVLVSTDSFARGIDLPNVKCVISYEVPLIFQIYVHRVGRTCRAGLPGCAVTLVDDKTAKHFYTSLSFFKKRKCLVKMNAPANDDALIEKYQLALKELQENISYEKSKEVQKRKDVKKLRKNNRNLKAGRGKKGERKNMPSKAARQKKFKQR